MLLPSPYAVAQVGSSYCSLALAVWVSRVVSGRAVLAHVGCLAGSIAQLTFRPVALHHLPIPTAVLAELVLGLCAGSASVVDVVVDEDGMGWLDSYDKPSSSSHPSSPMNR